MNQKVIVLGVEALDYFSKNQNKQVQMVKAHYYNPSDNLMQEGKRGFIPMVANLPIEFFETFKNGIGIYDFGYALRTFAGKPQLEVATVKFIKPLDMALGVA